MEFESVTLRVEKVVVGNGEGIVRLRPLSPGRYKFFDDFHQATNGVLVVK
jgi:cupredoxin-like protein